MKRFDIIAGKKYTKDGIEKTAWKNLGSAFEGDKGISLIFDAVPVGWDGRCVLREPRPRDNSAQLGMRGSKGDSFDPGDF